MRMRASIPALLLTALACGGGGSGGGGPTGPDGDTTPPAITVVSPAPGSTTAARSGFNIQLSFSDAGSGVDPASLSVTASVAAGGVLTRRGVSSTRAANSELSALFGSVSATGATLTVADSLGLAAGPVTLTIRVRDHAGNQGSATHSFSVAPNPDGIVLIDAVGGRGQAGVALDVGLRNGAQVAGAQLDLLVDAAIATIDSAYVLGRATNINEGGFGFVAPGRIRVALFDQQGSSIAAGEGVIVRLFATIAANATVGAHALTPADPRVAATNGTSQIVGASAASLTVQ